MFPRSRRAGPSCIPLGSRGHFTSGPSAKCGCFHAREELGLLVSRLAPEGISQADHLQSADVSTLEKSWAFLYPAWLPRAFHKRTICKVRMFPRSRRAGPSCIPLGSRGHFTSG